MSERRLILAIDCDDVLVSTAQEVVNNYNRRYSTHLELKDIYQPASFDTWGTDDDDVAIERVNEYLRSETHAAIAPDPEAVVAIRKLARHELHLVTGRANFLEPVTSRMLDTYFEGCFQSVEHTNFMAASGDLSIRRSKGDVCRALGAHILVDDHLWHGYDAIESHLERMIVFGNYPWNQQKELPDGMVRCVDWSAVLEEIDRMAKNG